SGDDNFKGHSAGLAGGDLHQRLALFGIGLFIKVELNGAIALVNRLGPAGREGEAEAIERRIAVAAFGHAPGADAFAEAGGWRRLKLTGAAVITIAGLEIFRV